MREHFNPSELMPEAEQKNERTLVEKRNSIFNKLHVKEIGLVLATAVMLKMAGFFEQKGGEEKSGRSVASERLSSEELEALKSIEPREVETTPDAIVLHFEKKGDKAAEQKIVPGDEIGVEGQVQMLWGEREFTRAEAERTERDAVEGQVKQMLDEQLKPYAEWGVAPHDVIKSITIDIKAYSSPEGWRNEKANQKLSEKRAQLVAHTIQKVIAERGLAGISVDIHVAGKGAEGDVLDFAQKVEALGFKSKAKDKSGKKDEAERIIRMLHDGDLTGLLKLVPDASENPELLEKIYQESVAVHRRADISIRIDAKNLDVRHGAREVPPMMRDLPPRDHKIDMPFLVPFLVLPLLLRRKRSKEEPLDEESPETRMVREEKESRRLFLKTTSEMTGRIGDNSLETIQIGYARLSKESAHLGGLRKATEASLELATQDKDTALIEEALADLKKKETRLSLWLSVMRHKLESERTSTGPLTTKKLQSRSIDSKNVEGEARVLVDTVIKDIKKGDNKAIEIDEKKTIIDIPPPPPPPWFTKAKDRMPVDIKRRLGLKYRPYSKHIGSRGAGFRMSGLSDRI